MKVFLCESIHPEAFALLQKQAEIISDWSRLAEADAIINRNLSLSSELLQKAVNLKVIAIHGTGTDGVDLDYCHQHQISVFRIPGENAESVAELIVALSLMLLRRLHLADRMICSGAATQTAPPELFGSELTGKTVGFIGTGEISQRAARIFRDGFHSTIIGFSPSLTPGRASSMGIGYCASITQVLQQSDIVSLGVPLNAETHNLMNNCTLAMMKPSAILINTTRGGVVDEPALFHALTEGKIAGAACDVFCSEPPGKDNPLIGLSNFIATPHLGANTEEALRRVGLALVQELFTVMAGNPCMHPC